MNAENAGGGRSGISLLVWLCILVLSVSFAILFAMINRGVVRSLDEFCQNNVHTRVRLYYGEGYGVSLASREGEGTAVTVRIKRCRS